MPTSLTPASTNSMSGGRRRKSHRRHHRKSMKKSMKKSMGGRRRKSHRRHHRKSMRGGFGIKGSSYVTPTKM